MKNTKVTPEAYKSILENGAWAQFGVKRTVEKKLDESKSEPKVETKPEAKDKKPLNEGKETVEKHVCPLCETELKGPISDEKLLEHAANMVEVFTEAEEELLTESEDDEDEDFDDEDFDEDEESDDESDEDEEVESDEEEE